MYYVLTLHDCSHARARARSFGWIWRACTHRARIIAPSSPSRSCALLVVVACLVGAASGLTGLSQALRAGAKSVKPSSSRSTCGVQEASRRHLLLAGAAALPVMGSPIAAIASGGATAGKTTSIPRAKVASSSRASF